MDIVLWLLAGAATGWATYYLLRMNEERGFVAALGIGALGGVLGGSMIAPLLTRATAAAGEGRTDALLVAVGVAAVLLVAGHAARRWGL